MEMKRKLILLRLSLRTSSPNKTGLCPQGRKFKAHFIAKVEPKLQSLNHFLPLWLDHLGRIQ